MEENRSKICTRLSKGILGAGLHALGSPKRRRLLLRVRDSLLPFRTFIAATLLSRHLTLFYCETVPPAPFPHLPHFSNSAENLLTSKHKGSLDASVTRHKPLAGYLFLPPSTHCPPSLPSSFFPAGSLICPPGPRIPCCAGMEPGTPGREFFGVR